MSHPPLDFVRPVVKPQQAALALYIIVFVSGAVLMGIEIAGAKILAPGFGTSTFVWGSIIGMFMGALAAGYYIGGNLSDKRPSFKTLAIIVSIGAIWTALLPRFGPQLSDTIALIDFGTAGKVVGPLLAAMVLFFIPSFLMGMVSPFSVKLNTSSLAGVGGVAGRLYALSTFGSIIGTLITTFVLIPTFKLSTVLMALGLFLLVAAIASLWLFLTASRALTRADATAVGVMGLVLLVGAESWAAFPVEPHVYPGQRMVHYEDSAYHEILVTEEFMYSDEKAPQDADGGRMYYCKAWDPENVYVRRWLKFNENIESGTYPYGKEHKNAVMYTDLLHVPLLWVQDPKKMLVVGGGGGIIPTQYYNWYKTEVDVAEIDGKVERVAEKYFDMPPFAPGQEKIHFHIGDGRQSIKRELTGPYDVIVLDAYSSGGQIPFHLMTWEFMALVKSKLKPGGVLITNIISGLQNGNTAETRHNADLFLAECKTLKASRLEALGTAEKDEDKLSLFKNIHVFPRVYKGYGLTTESLADYRNVIIVATDADKAIDGTPDSLEELAAQLSEKSTDPDEDTDRRTFPKEPRVKLDLWPIVRDFKSFRAFGIPTQKDLDSVPIMTDDYAPVDLMYRPVKHDENMHRIR